MTVTITAKGRHRIKKAFERQHAREHQWLSDLDRPAIDGLVILLRHLLEKPRPPAPARAGKRSPGTPPA